MDPIVIALFLAIVILTLFVTYIRGETNKINW